MILDRIHLCHSTCKGDRSSCRSARFRPCKENSKQGWNCAGMNRASYCFTRTFAALRLRRVSQTLQLAGLPRQSTIALKTDYPRSHRYDKPALMAQNLCRVAKPLGRGRGPPVWARGPLPLPVSAGKLFGAACVLAKPPGARFRVGAERKRHIFWQPAIDSFVSLILPIFHQALTMRVIDNY